MLIDSIGFFGQMLECDRLQIHSDSERSYSRYNYLNPIGSISDQDEIQMKLLALATVYLALISMYGDRPTWLANLSLLNDK
jgi:hypothetical protein